MLLFFTSLLGLLLCQECICINESCIPPLPRFLHIFAGFLPLAFNCYVNSAFLKKCFVLLFNYSYVPWVLPSAYTISLLSSMIRRFWCPINVRVLFITGLWHSEMPFGGRVRRFWTFGCLRNTQSAGWKAGEGKPVTHTHGSLWFLLPLHLKTIVVSLLK